MDAGAGLVGAIAVERRGDFTAPLRAAVDEMAMHLALAIDNARLMLRQRRFTAELAEKVAEATARLTELDRAKTEFVSVVAHELRTPLTALQGFTELLLSRGVPAERQARFLGHVHAEAQRLGRIVGELLDLSRIESGRPLALTPRPIDLAALLQRNVELFAVQHLEHRFEWSASPALAPIHADLDAVERILKNLISNAVKYSPRGGRVRLAAVPPRLPRHGRAVRRGHGVGSGLRAAPYLRQVRARSEPRDDLGPRSGARVGSGPGAGGGPRRPRGGGKSAGKGVHFSGASARAELSFGQFSGYFCLTPPLGRVTSSGDGEA